jgi:hypothetical protein
LQYSDAASSCSPQFEQAPDDSGGDWLPTGDVPTIAGEPSFAPHDLQKVQLAFTAALQDGQVFSSLVSRARSLSAPPHHLQ